MRFPTRPQKWLVGMMTLAAIPVCVAALRPERWDDCANPEALRRLDDVLEGEPKDVQRFFHSHVFQRDEGNLSDPGWGLAPLQYRIVRSDEPRYPVEQPTRFLMIPMDPDRSEVRYAEADGVSIPIHMMYAHFGGVLRVVASLYVYDGQPVDSLLPMQIRSALRQLLRGRRPITLFQVHGFGPPGARAGIEDVAVDWLRSAWGAYRDVCGSDRTSPDA